MEDVPPSYQSAIDREAWSVIAPWIPSGDLCSACLVSRKWHSIFVPFLWGDPARHFGIENDAVFVALTRFKRTLRKARASVRALTHTLHLPPALSEIYGGPNREWLRDVLEYLPNLQSLIVNKLPFFDHQSVLALRTPSNRRRSLDDDDDDIPVYGLKLLLAAHEPNATASSIAAGLPCFQALVYLDLSYTTPARDAAVLSSMGNLYDLQVLKLKGVGLRDGEAEVLANSIGIKVRLLDLQDNLLTDMAVRSLMQACFLPSRDGMNGSRNNNRQVEDWPVGIAPGPELFSLDTLRSEDLDHELLKQLTNPLTGRLAFEDIPHRGLTHLYISDNNLSVEGISSLLQSQRLHFLDAGSVDSVKTIARTRSFSSPTGYHDKVQYPGAEKLVPILAKFAAKNLTYLRIDHAVVTEEHDIADDLLSPQSLGTELPGTVPLAAELPPEDRLLAEAAAPAHYAVELSSEAEPCYELDASPAQPRYELIGDIMQFAISPPIGDAPEQPQKSIEEVLSPVRGEGPYAPEVVLNGHKDSDAYSFSDGDDDEEIVLNASGSGLTTKNPKEISLPAINDSLKFPEKTSQDPGASQLTQKPVRFPTHRSTPSTVHRQIQIQTLLRKRPQPSLQPPSTENGTNGLNKPLPYLHPSVLPNLRTFVLTNVPTTLPQSSRVIPAIKAFISACADEDALAHLRAQTNYSLPPGKARHAAELDHARSLFALRTIVLEMAQPGTGSKGKQKTIDRGWHNNKTRSAMSKSSTGDHDSENLWSAAENDFSFFGEEGEEHDECGIYDNEPEKYFPTAHMDDKIVFTPTESTEDVSGGRHSASSSSTHGSLRSLYLHQQAQASAISNTNNTLRSPTVLRSPRELPLGRNRRRSSGSGEFDRDRENLRERIFGSGMAGRATPSQSQVVEMQGSALPTPSPMPLTPRLPTSHPQPSPQSPSFPTPNTPTQPEEPTIDVIADLASWRRARKREYEDALVRWKLARSTMLRGSSPNGQPSPHNGASHPAHVEDFDERDMPVVPGHWKGEIKVVRDAAKDKSKGKGGLAAQVAEGKVDVYGNYFEKGYLYP